nr:MazG nucleotide pyrophosphohydrolase domain-containing protein [Brevibacterium yomogidense]
MAFIRARCPWAEAHTHRSLAPYLLEETVELMAALVEDEAARDEDPGTVDAVEAELADVLYQVLFHAALIDDRRGRAPGATWDSLQERIVGKYVRRHPHVFDSAHPVPLDDVQRRYQQVKAEEKEQRDAVSEPSAASHRLAADRALSILSEIRGTMDDRNRQD